MTFNECKRYIELKKRGDIKLPDTDMFKEAIYESLKNIANQSNIYPMHLITTDMNYELLRPIDKDRFVRVPKYPDDDVRLDIDYGLVYAVVYDFLERYTSDINRMQIYKAQKDKVILDYNWNMFNASELDKARNDLHRLHRPHARYIWSERILQGYS